AETRSSPTPAAAKPTALQATATCRAPRWKPVWSWNWIRMAASEAQARFGARRAQRLLDLAVEGGGGGLGLVAQEAVALLGQLGDALEQLVARLGLLGD